MLTFACVRMGTRYPIEYVEKLRNMIHRHAPKSFRHPRIVCLTDQPDRVEGVEMKHVVGLEGWWGKMALFDPATRGGQFGPVIYLDLDTVICDTLNPLIDFATDTKDFAVCANFTKRSGLLNYPCGYGSCVMVFPRNFGNDIWECFHENKRDMLNEAGPYGDQYVIERLHPNARLLQDELPSGFFVGRRQFDVVRPTGATLLIFAGKTKPDNCNIEWIKEQWQ